MVRFLHENVHVVKCESCTGLLWCLLRLVRTAYSQENIHKTPVPISLPPHVPVDSLNVWPLFANQPLDTGENAWHVRETAKKPSGSVALQTWKLELLVARVWIIYSKKLSLPSQMWATELNMIGGGKWDEGGIWCAHAWVSRFVLDTYTALQQDNFVNFCVLHIIAMPGWDNGFWLELGE